MTARQARLLLFAVTKDAALASPFESDINPQWSIKISLSMEQIGEIINLLRQLEPAKKK